jgi:alkylhydroperoxidase family enzyme
VAEDGALAARKLAKRFTWVCHKAAIGSVVRFVTMTDGRPLFAPLSRDEAVARATSAGIPTVLANPNVFRVLLHHPPVADVFARLVQVVVLDGTLDPRLREMAIMRAAWLRSSAYEWASHYGISLRIGLTDDEIVAIRSGPSAHDLASRERAVLAVVDEIVTCGVASSEVLGAARDAAGTDTAYLELLAIPGCYAALASILDALQVPLDDGVSLWPPDGVTPSPPD